MFEDLKWPPNKRTWAALMQRLDMLKLRGGVGVFVRTSAGGTTVSTRRRRGAGVASESGPFFSLFEDEAGDTYLQGGTVSGGNGGSETIANYKVLDAEDGPGTNANKVLYVEANCTATVEDGFMLPGCLLNTATLATGTSVPDNHTFSVASPTGNLYLEVGRWTATGFLQEMPGNLQVSGCIGDFGFSRI